jgi:serine/threonine-protein kinase
MAQDHSSPNGKCASCERELPLDSRFCPACGARVVLLSGEATGQFDPVEHLQREFGVNSDGHARFDPGQLLAGRYRIVALLGKGGMGEVYRADDLKLGQSVALKFLPAEVMHDAERLARFHGEVRIARQVSHPNVCRVYDIGEAGGQPLLTMEYIDGEDLASLLKRIGRLPEEKGIELARQICLGLAAAHDKGVLHRDLKPANVMLDGRGQARITDFGLAALADAAHDVRSGTPAYMAPEQLAGRSVSVQSDLYSLGLILYELFTGKRPFAAQTAAELQKAQTDSTPTKPSSHISGLNPEVEKIILRCLESDPRRRPKSAYEVVAGLPGSDPLAAALAAGQTPSPQMVADAPVEGSLTPWVAILLLGAVFGGMLLIAFLNNQTMLIRRVPSQQSPELLADKARQIIQRLGYGDVSSVDSAWGLADNLEAIAYLKNRDASPARWDALSTGQPAGIYFWYRQSPRRLVQPQARTSGFVFSLPGLITPSEPPLSVPSMVNVFLDLKGRLIGFQSVPPLTAPSGTAPAINWEPLFESADLKWSAFQDHVIAPRHKPQMYADIRTAWAGVYPDQPEIAIRVEAANCEGKPVFFQVEPEEESQFFGSAGARTNEAPPSILAILLTIMLVIVTGGAWLAWRNCRLGRANRSGALRLSIVMFVSFMLGWILLAHHTFSIADEIFEGFVPMAGRAMVDAALVWVMYLALEPYVRRRWPSWIVSWNRLLDARFRDPLVGRDILIGMLAAVCMVIVIQSAVAAPRWFGWTPSVPIATAESAVLTNPAGFVALLPTLAKSPLLSFFTLFILVFLLRRKSLGIAAWLLIWMGFYVAIVWSAPYAEHRLFIVSFFAVNLLIRLMILLRFGFLAFATMGLYPMLATAPFTTDYSAWYFHSGVFYALVIGGLAVYAFVISLGGRPLLSGAWLGDD